MDKIYSRNRIIMPKFKRINYDNKNIKKFIKIVIIIAVAVFTFYTISESVSSIYEALCVEKVMSLATDIINTEVNRVLLQYDYKDLVTVIKNDEDGTNILKTDVMIINKITSDLPIAIEARFQALEKEQIGIPIRSTYR